MTNSTVIWVSFLSIVASDALVRLNSFIGRSNGSTWTIGLLTVVSSIFFGILFARLPSKLRPTRFTRLFLMVLVAVNIVGLIVGAANARDYWDWKQLVFGYLLPSLVPIAMVVGLEPDFFFDLYRKVIKYLFPLSVFLIPLILLSDRQFFARIVIPINLFILLFPYGNSKSRLVLIVISALSLFVDVGYRINAIRIVEALVVTAGIWVVNFRTFSTKILLNLILIVILILPLILFATASYGIFNVFQDGLASSQAFDIDVDDTKSGTDNKIQLNADTRTFLYYDVLTSMSDKGSSLLFGEGGGSAYQSYAFADVDLNGRGRYGTEVGFLNILMSTGVFGVSSYAVMLFSAAYLGLNRSQNMLCKAIAIWLALRWPLLFVEDIPAYDINNLLIWAAVGVGLSPSFRNLTDTEVQSQVRRFQNEVSVNRL